MNDDAVLLRRYVAEQSEDAFAELVRRHLGFVYAAALRRLNGDSHGAADVAQTVFIKLARDAAKLSRHSALAGWLYTTTRNAAVDRVRVEQHRKAREQEVAAMQESVSSFEPVKEWERVRPLLDAAMDELEERDRTVILLRFFAGNRLSDIGDTLRISEDAARMRVDRALEKLHGLLERRGLTSSSVALSAVLTTQAGASAVTLPAGLMGSVTTTALANATVLAGSIPSVAAIFVAMTTKKLAVGLAVLIGVVGLTTIVYQSNRTDDPKVSLATVSSVRSVVANEPEQRASTANQVHALTERSMGEGDAAVKAGIVAWNSGKHQLPERRRLDKEAMQKDPRYPAYRAKSTDRWVELSYGAAFQQLGLSQTQIHRMRQLLAQRELSLGEFDSLAGKSSASKESLGTARQSAVSGIDAEIAGLIGMNYEQLKALRQRGGSLILLHSEASADLSIAGCPLRPEQANALAIIYHQRKPLPSAPTSSMGLPADLQQMFDMAQHHLSPTQLAVFLETLRTKAKFEQFIADHMVAPN